MPNTCGLVHRVKKESGRIIMRINKIDFGTGYRKNCLNKNAKTSNLQPLSRDSVSFGNTVQKIAQLPVFTTKYCGTRIVGPIKKLCQEASSGSAVRAFEEKMQSMGYFAKFEDDLSSAKIITDVYKNMNERGISLPKEAILFEPDRAGVFHYRPIAGHDERFSTPILFAKKFAERKVEIPEFFANQGVKPFSTEAPEGVVYRAIGEFLHEGRLGNPDSAEKWYRATDSNLNIMREVGYYPIFGYDAPTSRKYLPFVSEIFAGRMQGKDFSNSTMKLYEDLGGLPIV